MMVYIRVMRLYQYTLLKQNGTTQQLPICPQKDFKALYALLNCETIQVVPIDYINRPGRSTCFVDESGKFNPSNHRNPHFKVLTDSDGYEMDIVGDAVLETVYHPAKAKDAVL